MSLIAQLERIDQWNAAAEELSRRAIEYSFLAENTRDEVRGYRWAKRALRAVRGAMRCMDRSEALLQALNAERTPC